jgi:hypothetical protein
MLLTIEALLSDPNIVRAIIDRVMARSLDEIYWRRYLNFEQTVNRTFKTYIGTVTGVTAGSVIDKNSNKPIRQRRGLGAGYGEVAYLGDKYQLDNDRLSTLQMLIEKFNRSGLNQSGAINEIVNFMMDDYRQVLLAPHKRMDLVVGSLRSTGKAQVTLSDNPEGITLLDIDLPVQKVEVPIEALPKFLTYLKAQIEGYRTSIGRISVMEMTRSTFNSFILGSDEFQGAYTMVLSSARIATAAGLITPEMANQYLTGVGLPPIRIVEEYVAQADGTNKSAFEDNYITLLTGDNLGRMMWHTPYEAADPVPTKTYTRFEGGGYISSIRTDEGRFLEYGCEWIPNITQPNKIVIFHLTATPAMEKEQLIIKRGRKGASV